jgi:hypothetical protein
LGDPNRRLEGAGHISMQQSGQNRGGRASPVMPDQVEDGARRWRPMPNFRKCFLFFRNIA